MNRRAAFTFLELLVALAILVSAFAIVFTVFTSTLNAWQRGSEVLARLHHGDHVMDQLVQALRSTAFFDSRPDLYEFRLEKRQADGQPADLMSWVTSSAAFMPLDTPYAHGVHRLIVTVDRAGSGDYGVAVRAVSHLSEEEDEESDPWLVSTRVKGLRCRIFDPEAEDWVDEWEREQAIPSLLEITLYLEPEEQGGAPVRMQRIVTIPVAPVVTNQVTVVEE